MSDIAGEARVRITVDDSGVDQGARAAGDRVVSALRQAGTRITQTFRDAFKGAAKAADSGLDQMVAEAKAAGRQIDVAFRDLDGRLRGLNGQFIAEGSFDGLVQESREAAIAVAKQFRDAGVLSDQALERVGGAAAFDKLVHDAQGAGRGIVSALRNAAASAASAIGSALSAAASRIASAFAAAGRAVRDSLVGGLQLAVAAVGALTAATLTAGITYQALGQRANAALESILGSKDAAHKLLGEVIDLNKTSPFPRQLFIEAAQRLTAFGLDAKRVVPTINAIQDALGAVGGGAEEFQRVSLALGQIQAKGKLSAEEVLQLAEVGIPAARLLAEQFGITGAELADKMRAGAITAQQAIDGLVAGIEGKFAGAASNLFNTFDAAVSGLKGGLRDIGGALLEPFVSFRGGGGLVEFINSIRTGLFSLTDQEGGVARFVGALSPLNDIMDRLAGHFSSIAQQVQAFFDRLSSGQVDLSRFTDVIKGLGPLLGAAGAGLGTSFASSLPFVGQFLGKFNPILVGLTALVALSPELRAAFTDAFGALLDQVRPVLPLLADLGRTLLSIATDVIGPLLSGIVAFVGPLVAPLVALLEGLGEALGPLATTLGDALGGLLEGIDLGAFTSAFGEIANVVEALVPPLSNLASLIAGVLGRGLAIVLPILSQVIEILGGALTEVIQQLTPVLDEVGQALGDALVEILAALAPVLPPLAEAIGAIAVALAEVLVAIVPLLVPLLQFATLLIRYIGAPVLLAVALAVAVLATALAKLVGFIARLIPTTHEVANAVRDLWHGVLVPTGAFLRDTFLVAVSAVASALSGGFHAAVNAVGAVLSGVVVPAAAAVGAALGFLFSNVLVPLGRFLAGAFLAAIRVIVLVEFPVLVALVGLLAVGLGILYRNVLLPLGRFLGGVLAVALRTVAGLFRAGIGLAVSVAAAAFERFQTVVGVVGGALAFLRDNVVAPLGRVLSSVIGTAVDQVAAAFRRLQTVAGVLASAIGPIRDALGTALSAAAGFLADSLGRLQTALQAIQDALGAVARFINSFVIPALKIVGLVLIGPLLLAIGAIVIGVASLYEFALKPLASFLVTVLTPVVQVLVLALGLFVQGVVTLATVIAQGLVIAVQVVFALLDAFYQLVLRPLAEFLLNVVVANFQIAAGVITGLFNLAVGAASFLLQALYVNVLQPLASFLGAAFALALGLAGAAWHGLGLAVSGARTVLEGIYLSVIKPLVDLLQGGLTLALGVAAAAWGVFKDAIGGVADILGGIIDVAGDVVDAIQGIIDKIEDLPGGGLVSRGLSALSNIDGNVVALPQGGVYRLGVPPAVRASMNRRAGYRALRSRKPTAAAAGAGAGGKAVTYHDNREIHLHSVDGLGEADVRRLNNRLAVAAAR